MVHPSSFPLVSSLALLSLSSLAAQVPAAELQIAGAVSAAPAALQDGAEVRGYRNYHRRLILRPGSTEMICLADDPAEGGWHVACYHRDLEPFMVRGRQLREQGVEGHEAIDSARLAEIQAGTLKMPDGPRMLYNLYAPSDSVDAATGLAHGAVGLQVVYIPFATPGSTGLSDQPGGGLPWLMAPGKPWAHIMIMR